MLAIISKRAGDTYQGTVQGFVGSAGAIASIIGFAGGGLLYTLLGPLQFIIAAVVILLVAVTLVTLKN